MYIDIIKNGLAGSKCEPIIEMAKKMIVNIWNDALNSDEFYTLPLNHLLDIMSRFNWSNLKGDHSRLNQIIQKTIAANPKPETLQLLNIIKPQELNLTSMECLKIIKLFT